jgi:DegV family protein with EDD domain
MTTQHTIALITDSTCDIPDELLALYEIALVPASISWGSDILLDRIEIGAAEFYRRLTTDPIYPTTACPSPEHFRQAYETARDDGAAEVVVVTVSSAMSGTYRSALLAAELVDFPVHVIDARGPTLSSGWQALAAARAREAVEGAAPDDVPPGSIAQAMIEAAERARRGMAQWVALDTLEYLHKGGRIGNATRFIGTLLNIKPLVYINHESGLVEAGQSIRTRRRSIEALYQSFFGQLGLHPGERCPLRMAVLHGGAPEEAAELAQRIRQEYQPVELLETITSPVLGVHTGPRALALCGYVDQTVELPK